MRNISLTMLLSLALATSLWAQPYFGKELIVGSSLTYIWDGDREIVNNYFHEFTWDKTIAVQISRPLFMGLSYKNIYTSGSSYFEQEDNGGTYFLVGVFGLYELHSLDRSRFFIEMSYSLGNYCDCGPFDPYKSSTLLSYFGVGGSVSWPIWKDLFLDIGFTLQPIIGKRGNYNIYNIGVNYFLGTQP
ncbi:MAG TPA: hypothetical protein PKA00_23415 [Saprospiraceae bacterium]|nr:hypothetical protein [Saprospiraceae bacterium]